MAAEADSPLIVPARRSRMVHRAFCWWLRRMLRKQFNAVRIAVGTADVLRSLDGEATPAIVLMNHSSWWDPLVGLHLGVTLHPSRPQLAPMEAAQLAKFGFFRKLGVFGLDPDNPASLRAMLAYVTAEYERDPRSVLWLTPQGTFTDVRAEVRLRPGAAALAAHVCGLTHSTPVRVVCVAVELGFWTEQKPEMFVRVAECGAPSDPRATTAWQRAMTSAMNDNARALAALVMNRDPDAFEVLGRSGTTAVNPLFDSVQRLRGQSTRIEATDRRREPSVTRSRGAPPTTSTPTTHAPPGTPAPRAGGLEGAA